MGGNNIKRTESEFSQTWLDNGIVYQEMKKGIKCINFETAVSLVMDKYSVAGHNNIPSVFILNDVFYLTPQAISFYRTDVAYEHKIAQAIIVKNVITKVAGNLVLKFTRLKVPFAFFTGMEKAQDWLGGYRGVL